MSTSITVPKTWREFPQRYRLEASKCKTVGKYFFHQGLFVPIVNIESLYQLNYLRR